MFWNEINTILWLYSQWCFSNKMVLPFFRIRFNFTLMPPPEWRKKSPCLAFSLLVKLSPIKLDFRRIGRICHGEQIYFSSAFHQNTLFDPNPPPLLLLVCSQFWSGLSGLAGLRWCKYHIQTAHCFLVLRVGVGGDDHSMENLSISIAMTLNPEFGAHKLSHLHQLAKMDPTSLTILKVRVIGWSRRS